MVVVGSVQRFCFPPKINSLKALDKQLTTMIQTHLMKRSKLEKEQIAATINSQKEESIGNSGTVYKDEVEKRIKDQENGSIQAIPIESGEKKPRLNEESTENIQKTNITHQKNKIEHPNSQKCLFSPFAYHRFTRSIRETLKDGTHNLIMRCRYCHCMINVRISFVLREGRYVAVKETIPVEEANQ